MATRGVTITGLNTLPNVTANTVLVSVDTTVDETLKTNVQSLGNFILSQAGNIFPVANVANTVRNNAQPNIRSVGTLVSLSVSGITQLGPVGNVKITGGNAGQLLDRQITEMQTNHPGVDVEHLAELKKKKLQLKDEIGRLTRLQWEEDTQRVGYGDE